MLASKSSLRARSAIALILGKRRLFLSLKLVEMIITLLKWARRENASCGRFGLIVEMKKPTHLLLLITAALFCLSSIFVTTNAAQRPKPNILPRVTAIGKSDEATGNSWSGCDNHFLMLPNTSIEYECIFISNADGLIAWMNLNGRNVRLESVKTTLWYRRSGSAFARHEYRAVGLPQCD